MADHQSTAAPSLAYIFVLDRKEGADLDHAGQPGSDYTREESHQHASCLGQETNGNGHSREHWVHHEPAARYTAALLKSTLLLMGCKPRVAHKASNILFWAGHVVVLETIHFSAGRGIGQASLNCDEIRRRRKCIVAGKQKSLRGYGSEAKSSCTAPCE